MLKWYNFFEIINVANIYDNPRQTMSKLEQDKRGKSFENVNNINIFMKQLNNVMILFKILLFASSDEKMFYFQ